MFLKQDCSFSFHLGELLVHGLLQVFESLSLLVKLLFGLVLLNLDSLYSLSMVSHELFSIIFESFFVSLDSVFLLSS